MCGLYLLSVCTFTLEIFSLFIIGLFVMYILVNVSEMISIQRIGTRAINVIKMVIVCVHHYLGHIFIVYYLAIYDAFSC